MQLATRVIHTPQGVESRWSPLWAKRLAQAKLKAVRRLNAMANISLNQFPLKLTLVKVSLITEILLKFTHVHCKSHPDPPQPAAKAL